MPEPMPQKPKARRASPRWPGTSIALHACLIASCLASAADAQFLQPNPQARRKPDEDIFARLRPPEPTYLDRLRPLLPEWLAMALEILDGDQVRPGRGWFDGGRPRTRFTWDSVASRLDRDRNGSIARKEFPGTDVDFRRLDRDMSGTITAADFEFPGNALEKSRSRMIMSFADRNSNGKVEGAEYSRMIFLANRDLLTKHANFADAIETIERAYEASSKEGLPYITASDLRNTVDITAKTRSLATIPDVDGDFEKGTKPALLKAFLNRELGSLRAGPTLGDPAPHFTLPTFDGAGRVELAKLLGKRPVVLIFANYTSPGIRAEAGSLEKLFRRYRDRAEFLLVYVREEHPSDGWISKENAKLGINVAQPTDERGRAAVARQFREKLGLTLPTAVDFMDDRVGILYSGMPGRLYLLDAAGAVAYKGGRGPFGFKPDELEQSLILLLQAEAGTSTAPADATPPRDKVEPLSTPGTP